MAKFNQFIYYSMKNCISSSQRWIDPMSQDALMPPNVGSR